MSFRVQNAPAVDVDAAWMGWTGEDRGIRVGDFSTTTPRLERLSGLQADCVLPGFRPGTFLLIDGGQALRRNVAGARAEGGFPVESEFLGLLDLDDGAVGGHRLKALAATKEALVGLEAGEWQNIVRLDAPPVHLAWQHRRRSAIVVTRRGTVVRVDPVSGRVGETWSPDLPGSVGLACYDEVLGGVWTVPEGATPQARFLRIEPWPPRELYTVSLPAAPRSLGVSHSGEWLLVSEGKPGTGWLYNVNGRRSFTPPPAMAQRDWGAAFTYSNQLVAVHDDEIEVTEIPARADIRAPDGDLAIATLWERSPRMHRARWRGGA